MFTQKPTSRPEVAWVGFALTWAAGFVDAIGFLTLREIYVANMSGNTVAVAIHVANGDWGPAWAHFCPLLAFVPGLVAGDAIVELCKRAGLRVALAPAFLVEAAGLGLFLFVATRSIPAREVVPAHNGAIYVLMVGLLAFSMGLQNGLLRRVSGLKDVHTYVTGTLLAAAHGFTTYFFWLGARLRHLSLPRLRRALRYSPHHRSLREALLASALWVLYIVGAVTGAILRSRYGIYVLLTPVGILLMVGAVDALSPVRKLRR
jgi:uncharacterized membrane protein YoaK (UPF0700 family)